MKSVRSPNSSLLSKGIPTFATGLDADPELLAVFYFDAGDNIFIDAEHICFFIGIGATIIATLKPVIGNLSGFVAFVVPVAVKLAIFGCEVISSTSTRQHYKQAGNYH